MITADLTLDLMSDDFAISDINLCLWANIIVLLISKSAGQKVCLLGWLDDDFELSDDEPMILMANPLC